MFVRHCCVQTRNFYSLHQLKCKNSLKSQLPRTSFFSNVRFKSSESDKNKAEKVTPENDERKAMIIRLELNLLLEQGRKVPRPGLLKKEQWDQLLALKTKSARNSLYKFLFEAQMISENEKIKQLEGIKVQKHLETLEPKLNDPTGYGLGKNSFLIRINSNAINGYRNARFIDPEHTDIELSSVDEKDAGWHDRHVFQFPVFSGEQDVEWVYDMDLYVNGSNTNMG